MILPRIALATCTGHPDLWIDDAPLVAALRRQGAEPGIHAWDDPAVDWSAYDVTVIRSTWDYVPRRDEFVAWAERVGDRLRNLPDVVRWNTDKTYLRVLADRGVPVVPTRWLEPGAQADLGALVRAEGWSEAVVKPAVSAGSRQTLRFTAAAAAAAQALAAEITGTVMVQPYLDSVEDHGERSLMFFAGEFSHAVRRAPSLGVAGAVGEAAPAAASAEELALARQVLAAAGGPLLYARVDLIRDGAGTLRLIELEAVEPQLFLRFDPEPAERLAAAILTAGGAGSGGSSTTSGS